MMSFDLAPARAYWEITRACDLACRHCRAEATPTAPPGELTPAQGRKLLDRIAAFDPPPHVVLTGGDPLKRADLFELIAHARSVGIAVSVSPSGTPLLTAEAITRLEQAGIDAISLSLDGSTAASHDALRGVSGTFDRTMQAALTANQVGLKFQVNTLVSQETLSELPAIAQIVSKLRPARWSLFFLVTVGRGTVLQPIDAARCESLLAWLASLELPGTIVTTTEAPHFRRIVAARHRATPRPAAGAPSGSRPPPGRPGHAAGIRDGNGIMFISFNGDVSPSGFLPLVAGNVKIEDPVKIYRDSPLFLALRKPDGFGGRCGRCEYRGSCGGSRARAWAATGDPLAEDPLCPYEPRGAPASLANSRATCA